MLLHLHHVLDPCGFTVLYLHQSSGSGRHFGKCIGVDGWFVCVSVSLPFLLVCVCVLRRFSVYVMDQEHERTIASGTERTANRSSSSSTITITDSNSSNISVGGFGKLQRPETRNRGQLFEPSIHPNPQCPIRRRHFLKPGCTSHTIYIHSSHRPGPELVLERRPAQAASLVCGFVQADDFFMLLLKYFQYSQLKLRQLTKVSLENTTIPKKKFND